MIKIFQLAPTKKKKKKKKKKEKGEGRTSSKFIGQRFVLWTIFKAINYTQFAITIYYYSYHDFRIIYHLNIHSSITNILLANELETNTGYFNE